ncbi:hypothetical protein KQ940_19625 [Marinobacterium sp. D7]|uniref:hypothetical protein n=1 Tax=Marinobacterium ramblicola TaxID=2849041 RepID=UPI001C2D1259|nr:hypothetical protein [Marinobacterium ramblicola]MBV1790271.1 hypothetical protein [Marinobacterium ramblicola]
MSRKNPHVIMGELVKGSSSQGYSVSVAFYKSTLSSAYKPDAKDMLDELESDIDRKKRLIKVRARKVAAKLAAG